MDKQRPPKVSDSGDQVSLHHRCPSARECLPMPCFCLQSLEMLSLYITEKDSDKRKIPVLQWFRDREGSSMGINISSMTTEVVIGAATNVIHMGFWPRSPAMCFSTIHSTGRELQKMAQFKTDKQVYLPLSVNIFFYWVHWMDVMLWSMCVWSLPHSPSCLHTTDH